MSANHARVFRKYFESEKCLKLELRSGAADAASHLRSAGVLVMLDVSPQRTLTIFSVALKEGISFARNMSGG